MSEKAMTMSLTSRSLALTAWASMSRLANPVNDLTDKRLAFSDFYAAARDD
jgi:hypothetical protein